MKGRGKGTTSTTDQMPWPKSCSCIFGIFAILGGQMHLPSDPGRGLKRVGEVGRFPDLARLYRQTVLQPDPQQHKGRDQYQQRATEHSQCQQTQRRRGQRRRTGHTGHKYRLI